MSKLRNQVSNLESNLNEKVDEIRELQDRLKAREKNAQYEDRHHEEVVAGLKEVCIQKP